MSKEIISRINFAFAIVVLLVFVGELLGFINPPALAYFLGLVICIILLIAGREKEEYPYPDDDVDFDYSGDEKQG